MVLYSCLIHVYQDMAAPDKAVRSCRYADKLEAAHDEEHLAKFEELLEAAVDLDRIPDEYLICASYDADLQVRAIVLPQHSIASIEVCMGTSGTLLTVCFVHPSPDAGSLEALLCCRS